MSGLQRSITIDFSEAQKILPIPTVKHEIRGPKRPMPHVTPVLSNQALAKIAHSEKEKEELAILQPARKKPASVEAERIYSVVDLAVQKIKVVSFLTSDHAGVDRAQSRFPPLLKDAIAKNRALQVQLRNDYREDTKEILNQNTKSLLTMLLEDSYAWNTLSNLNSNVDAGTELFYSNMVALRNGLFENLLVTSHEERARQDLLETLSQREEKLRNEASTLEAELTSIKNAHAVEIGKRDTIIASVEAEIIHILSQGEQISKRLAKQSTTRTQQEQVLRDTKKTDLNTTIQSLQKTLLGKRNEHKDIETKLRKRKLKLEAEIHEVVEKFDKELYVMQAEIDERQIELDEMTEKCSMLQVKADQLRGPYDIILVAKEEERLRAKTAFDLLTKQTKAAVTIQKKWRQYWAAKLAAKSAKKSAKKGKGKDGKGKGSAKTAKIAPVPVPPPKESPPPEGDDEGGDDEEKEPAGNDDDKEDDDEKHGLFPGFVLG